MLDFTLLNEAQKKCVLDTEGPQLVFAGPGAGKCLGKGTPVLMYDGSIKVVEDILPGDLLMGPDSLPRTVLSTTSGQEELFRVIPIKGEPWICNRSHILALQMSGKDSCRRYGKFQNIAVNDFLKKGSRFKNKAKLYRSGCLAFPYSEEKLPVEPYLLGYWLGNGTKKLNTLGITTPYPEIAEYLNSIAETWRLNLRKLDSNGTRCPSYYLSCGGPKGQPKIGRNKLLSMFQSLDLSQNPHIPQQYKVSAIEDRRALLTGLLDSDGNYAKGYYEVTFKQKILAEDTAFIARSLGLAAYVHDKWVKWKGALQHYYRVTISGDFMDLSFKIPKRKTQPRQQIKNVLVTGFDIESIGVGDYYGFELSGDGLFLLGDFTVTHNTRVLTHRIAHIIEKGLVEDPASILALTFTNKAADEMVGRIRKLLGNSESKPTAGNFHRTFLKILKAHIHLLGRSDTIAIYDEDDQEALIKKLLDELEENPFKPKDVQAALGLVKAEYLNPAQLIATREKFPDGPFGNPIFEYVGLIYENYQKELLKNNAVDFEDMLFLPLDIFRKFPEVLDFYQRKFKYILADEQQDANKLQFLLIKNIAQNHRNIFAVLDDDQALYRFRGATPEIVDLFKQSFPEVKVNLLEQNYRSSRNIVEVSKQIVAANVYRQEKNLWTANVEGNPVFLYEAQDQYEEASWIGNMVSRLQDKTKNLPLNEIAILYRTNWQSRPIEDVLLRARIPYRIIGNVTFYERKEVKDLLAYLKIIYNRADELSLKRAINTPKRGIGDATFNELAAAARFSKKDCLEYILEKSYDNTKVLDFADMMNLLLEFSKSEKNVGNLIEQIMETTLYFEYLNKSTKTEKEAADRKDNVRELITLGSEYDSLEKFLEDLMLLETLRSRAEDKKTRDAVTLMTIHAAKGTEYTCVFVAGVEKGFLPHSRSVGDELAVEEERRLLYVAVSRAKKFCALTGCAGRFIQKDFKRTGLSYFLTSVKPELLKAVNQISTMPERE